jgi:hypothetical protein
MSLRPRRRNLVVWSQSGDTYGGLRLKRRARNRRIRRWIRIGMLVTLLGLLPLARGVRARWRPLLAGTALTVAGIIMRGNPTGSIVLLPGLLLLLSAPLLPGAGQADRLRRTELERELAGYWTTAQRYDLEATLDRYPDDVTREVRDILARQAAATTCEHRVPGLDRYRSHGF